MCHHSKKLAITLWLMKHNSWYSTLTNPAFMPSQVGWQVFVVYYWLLNGEELWQFGVHENSCCQERLWCAWQVQNPFNPKYSGTIQDLKLIWKNNGIPGFGEGNGTSFAWIILNLAVNFYSYEQASSCVHSLMCCNSCIQNGMSRWEAECEQLGFPAHNYVQLQWQKYSMIAKIIYWQWWE